METIFDIKIEIPKSYDVEDVEGISQSSSMVTEIPGSINKVRRITIRGILKHGTTFC